MTKLSKNTQTPQCDKTAVMRSLLLDLKNTIDYLKETREWNVQQKNTDREIAYNTSIGLLEDLYENYA
jgi:hypothetical protein